MWVITKETRCTFNVIYKKPSFRNKMRRRDVADTCHGSQTNLYFNWTRWKWTEKAMAPQSSTLAWKIPWIGEAGRLLSVGSLRVRHDWATSLSLFTFMHWRRKWQPTPVFLPGESQGWGSLVGCRLWDHMESDTTEVTWQQVKVKVKVAQSCLTLCDPMGYTVLGILQDRILEWVLFPFFRGPQSRDQTQVSHIADVFFTSWATREDLNCT